MTDNVAIDYWGERENDMELEDKGVVALSVGKTLNEKLEAGLAADLANGDENAVLVDASATATGADAYEVAPSLGVCQDSSTAKDSDVGWFVLYVRSGSEDKILRALHKTIDVEAYIPFMPTKQLPNFGKKKKDMHRREAICFPGYIFFRVAKTGSYVSDFFDNVVRKATSLDGAYFFLYYGVNKNDIEMHLTERTLLERLMNSEFCMEASIGFQEGDKVRVVSGALMGFESAIKKIHKHQRTCECEFALMGTVVKSTLALEVLEKL